jgi:GT2 family glycosyltransferase
LNDDTEPCGPDWLRALEEHAQRPEVGAVGAKLLYPDGRIQHAGIAVGIGGLAGHPFRFRREAPDEIRDVSAVTAACLMVRREVFGAVGGFDERLPVNSNDVDLCLASAPAASW